MSAEDPAEREADEVHGRVGPDQRHEPLADEERYQTVYASTPGSAAAPTAGLHFTPELLDRLAADGVPATRLTLHVGPGTFVPVTTEDPRDHVLEAERYRVTPAAADAINATRSGGGRVVAVGTTSVRTLEYAAGPDGRITPGSGRCDLFIYPGYGFRVVDAMITNFHLPQSSLLMLVSAFAGREEIMQVYESAVQEQYRFFSFGHLDLKFFASLFLAALAVRTESMS